MIKDYSNCEYESERKVFSYLEKNLPNTSDLVLYPNFNLFDHSKSTYLECDAIVVTRSFIAIIELKDWQGKISVLEPKWNRGSTLIDSPHIVNNRKCKVLKSYIQHLLMGTQIADIPFVKSVVVLTNETARVEGSTTAKALNLKEGTVTLDGVQELNDYLKKNLHQLDTKIKLKDTDFHKLVEKLNREYDVNKADYTDQIPGYRIREDKGVSATFNTYLAEANPNIDNRLYRLRVFGKQSEQPSLCERQLRSLKAAASLTPHPNISSVRSHPNERGLIVEVSDWSDTKILEDLLTNNGRIDWRLACNIVSDISSALSHIHDSQLGLVHRNVCAKSILLNLDNHAQLTDFDLAFDPGSALTVVGNDTEERLNPDYTAQEVYLGQVDFKSDIYSLGVVLYRALSGTFPNNIVDDQISSLDTLQLDDLKEKEKSELITTIVQMLSVNSKDRPTTIEINKLMEKLLKEGEPATIFPSLSFDNNEETTYTSEIHMSQGSSADIYKVDNHGDIFIHKVFKADIPRELVLQERDFLRAVDRLNLPIFFPRVRHFSEKPGRWCLATDLVPGEPIRSQISKGIKPSIEIIVIVSEVLLEALEILHQSTDSTSQLIHNDINPNNILWDENSGAVGLIDFGCASHPGVVSYRGTVGYVDPSIVSKGEMNACPKGDLYGLAITLGEWLFGSANLNEWESKSINEAKLKIIFNWLKKAIENSNDQYQSASEMHNELIKFKSKLFSSNSSSEAKVESDKPRELGTRLPPSAFFVPQNPLSAQDYKNEFVSYLNTLHNVSAGNANALAEYQSVSEFFGSIYEPADITTHVYDRLTANEEEVIVLSGHAGDGKSTIALDILKKLLNINLSSPLKNIPNSIEEVNFGNKKISIVKDMSEHTSVERLETFRKSITKGTGSWLIVSNTGPLLNTLLEVDNNIEQKVLNLLDRPVNATLNDHSHLIDGFEKLIYVANLSKIDNTQTAVKMFRKIIEHPSWNSCKNCVGFDKCPIQLNVKFIKESQQIDQRISWIYRLLNSYETRLTMRQMTAHLAHSITGGLDCFKVLNDLERFSNPKSIRSNLFSELFFGYSDTERSANLMNLYCVKFLNLLTSEPRTRPAIEHVLQRENIESFSTIPEMQKGILKSWMDSIDDVNKAAKNRGAIRRLLYVFGTTIEGSERSKSWWKNFVEEFTDSPRLVDWELWRANKSLPSTNHEKRALKRQILSVLSEYCTGFVSSSINNSKLYVTLRRDDLESTQPVQVIIGEYDESEFELQFDGVELVPLLTYIPFSDSVKMKLSLPLLDFVQRRSIGDFGKNLDPIYINQLDLFCSQLVLCKPLLDDDIRLLSFGITGEQKVFKVEIDGQRMEIF